MKKSLLKKICLCMGLLVICSNTALAKKVRYTSQALRDPFQNPFEIYTFVEEEQIEPSVVGSTLGHLRVQGIVWGTDMPQAIVNNTVVKVGEVIGGAEIVDIRKEGVYVLYKGGQYILRPIIK